jgi:hypothetical protein
MSTTTTKARKPVAKAKITPALKAKMERWKQFDPSWMWERKRPADAATRENAVLMNRRLHGS